MKSKTDDGALKITHQIRPRGLGTGMTYGLTCQGVVLTLVVTPRSSERDPDEWLVEARVKRVASDVTAAEWGATRLEALRAVGRAWDAQRHTHGLAMFDWEAVSRALHVVRAV